MNYTDYILTDRLPLFWCAGCGDGIVLQALTRSFAELELAKEDIVVVTGIGCWGKGDDYIDTNTFHGTHGRALPYATGIKLANPRLKVVALMGDGDGVTIGGNHFIHTARRNVDITAIVVNNFNYGMTGGQYSGTTPMGAVTTTSRYGHLEPQFDICDLARSAGAPFVARQTVNNPIALKNTIKQAIDKKGFSLVEVIAPCPTHFGRLNGMKTPFEMMTWIKDNSVSIAAAQKMQEEELAGKFVIGTFCDKQREDYSTKYEQLIASIAQKGGDAK